MSKITEEELGELPLDVLNRELRKRGWRIVPVEWLGALVSGFTTGWWPSLKSERHEEGEG